MGQESIKTRNQIIKTLVDAWERLLNQDLSSPDDLKELLIRLQMLIGIQRSGLPVFTLDRVTGYFQNVQKALDAQTALTNDKRNSWRRVFSDHFCELERLLEKAIKRDDDHFPELPDVLPGRMRIMPMGRSRECWICGDTERADMSTDLVREDMILDRSAATEFAIGFRADGHYTVDVELLKEAPLLDPYDWDEVFEASLEISGILSISGSKWYGAEFALSGSHIVRIHSKLTPLRRQLYHPSCHYLVQLWPGMQLPKRYF